MTHGQKPFYYVFYDSAILLGFASFGSESCGAVQGTLVMFPLAALVAVAQTAPDGEGHGNLVRNLQRDALGQVWVVVIQNDGFPILAS